MTATNDSTTKRCTKCGQELPATPEYFLRDSSKKDGLRPDCKQCKHKPKQLFRLPDEWECRDCGVIKPATTEYFEKKDSCRGGLSRRCKDCATKYKAQWAKANPDKIALSNKRYRLVHNEAINAYSRKWKKNNPERVRQSKRLSQRRRRARLRGALGDVSLADIEIQYKSQRGLCWWCGDALDRYEIDHRVPVSKGGAHTPRNIVLACPNCNRHKSDKLPHEWNGRLL